jgi:hypothetical protein
VKLIRTLLEIAQSTAKRTLASTLTKATPHAIHGQEVLNNSEEKDSSKNCCRVRQTRRLGALASVRKLLIKQCISTTNVHY